MGGRFDKGVSFYTVAETTLRVNFPEDDVKCQWCPFVKHYDGMNRDKCSLTDEILISREIIGLNCPLTILTNAKTEDMKA